MADLETQSRDSIMTTFPGSPRLQKGAIVGIELDPQVIYAIVGAASAYVAGQGLADFGKNAVAEPASG